MDAGPTADLSRYCAVMQYDTAVRARHHPSGIYRECEHDHSENDAGVVDCEGYYSCADGKLYDICAECCTNWWGDQTRDCANYHDHRKDWRCGTLRDMDGEDGWPTKGQLA
jgi:hypothetical protein